MSDDTSRDRQAGMETSGPGAVPPPLLPGDPAPWFSARSDVTPNFKFSTLGGRYVVLSFLRSFSRPGSRAAFEAFLQGAQRFVPFTTAMILVTSDAADEGAAPPADMQGVRFFFDDDQAIAKMFGAATADSGLISFILDERLRVAGVIKSKDAADHAAQVYDAFDRMPKLRPPHHAQPQAPVLIVPHVFEPDFCAKLIQGYRNNGGAESGHMVERDGMTVLVVDHAHKRRSDWNIEDQALIRACHARIQRRIVPEIARAFQFHVTRIERNTVACYTAEAKGHFARHRDNTTKGTAHRRFAVSINLNASDYDGGDLVFPEFGAARFRPPTGGACIFSCSLLHEATPVTRGERFVYVPFLYDEQGAAVRQQNEQFLARP